MRYSFGSRGGNASRAFVGEVTRLSRRRLARQRNGASIAPASTVSRRVLGSSGTLRAPAKAAAATSMSLTELLFGRALSTEEEEGERVGPATGVGLLGLDALASAAYGPEALLTVLMPLGARAPGYALPLTLFIAALLLLVAISYRQTISAYPNGGGAYTVAKENLGESAALLAAAALGVDYVLNVAVAISAGIGALVSAVPALLPHTLLLALGVLALLTLLNLRGVRSTGLFFLAPTYLFLGSMACVIGRGLWGLHHAWPQASPIASVSLTGAPAWLLLRAFANGCTAMTGVEAVSNGVPLFRSPSDERAKRTLSLIVACLVGLLLGMATLARALGIQARPPGAPGYQSVISELAVATFGRGPASYAIIATVIAVLTLSANTSFADFPRVCKLLAADRYLPESLMHRGRRLTFSHGIIVLSVLAALLLVVFGGITDALIPLFAVGALSAFTMSQLGMVAHWRRRRGAGARRGQALNAAGALATGATLLAVVASKLLEGAWVTLGLIGGMLLLFRGVRSHYGVIAGATALEGEGRLGALHPALAVVPMRRWDAVSLKATRFALGLSENVLAVQVLTGDRDDDDLSERWETLKQQIGSKSGARLPRLLVLRSAFRELYAPLLELVERLEKEHADRPIVIVVGELIEERWYHHLLHDHTASLLKALLLYRGGPQTVIVSVPFYLRAWRPERRWLTRRGAG